MGNIILNDDLHISTTKLSTESSNDLEGLSFYVSKKYNESNICVAITDCYGVFDIIPLTHLRTDANYKVYCIDCKNGIRISSGECKMIFFVFDKQLQNCKASDSLVIDLDVENYNLFHQTYLSRKILNGISDYYEKILKMTNVNIEIYNKLHGEGENK